MTINFEELKQQISTWKQVVIIPHTRPDGDAMGSCLALHHYFVKKNIQSVVIAPSYYPEFLHWLPGNSSVWQFLQKQPQTTSVIKKADAVFCLDFNDLSRIDRIEPLVAHHAQQIITIDHHLEPKHFAHQEMIDSSASSTCELVYRFIEQLGDADAIDKTIATCLYTGIYTDTGGFKHNSTTAETHRVAANLMEAGANIDEIHDQLLSNSSANRLQFTGHALCNRLKFYPFLHAAMIYVSKEDAKEFELEGGDTEGLVNFPLSVKGIKLAVLIKEDEGFVKFSFRSKAGFVVNEMASKHFQGGGHAQASGGKLDSSLDEAIKTFEKVLTTYKEQLAMA